MSYASSVGQWLVYSAEQSIGDLQPITADDARRIVHEAQRSAWWREAFAFAPPIEVVVGGEDFADEGYVRSYAEPIGELRPTRFVVSLHPDMLFVNTLVHELAHCVMPRVWGDAQRILDGDVGAWGRYPTHGRYFTAAQSILAERLMSGVERGALVEAYEFFGVEVAAVEELWQALAAEPDLYAAREVVDSQMRDWAAEVEQERNRIAMARTGRPAAPPVIPTFEWGWWLLRARRDQRSDDGRMISQKTAAARISEVFPCTARQISALEHSQDRPTDPDQLVRAMLLSILLGVDPIWTRFEKRLTRWDCGDITMAQARILNPGWADLVEHMNELVRLRPARWDVAGTLE